MLRCLPEELKVVKLYHGAANAVASDVISCKNAVGPVWILVHHYGGGGDTDLVLSLAEHTAVGESAVAITDTFPIWANTDVSAGDVVSRQTDAANYTIDTGDSKDHTVMFQWDPAKFSAGYDCLSVADSGGNASNTCTIFAIYEARDKGDTLAAAITD